MKKPLPIDLFPSGATTVPELRKAAKTWAAQNQGISPKELGRIVTVLLEDPGLMKKAMGGILLGYMPVQRPGLAQSLNKWLDHTAGWAAVDSVCYGNFTAQEILGNFAYWKTLIGELAESGNINKRRAALVLLTKPVKESKDPRLSKLAFHIIDRLKEEKAILITKAVSWLLRSLIKQHREELTEYLRTIKDGLPAIAVRETENKLRSGRKSGRLPG